MEPLPSKCVHWPTWKVQESAPVETMPPSASNNGQSSPAENNNHNASPIESVACSNITPANQFDVKKQYQQRTEDKFPVITNISPNSLTNNRDITDIINPYLNISSILFNLAWRHMQRVASSSGHASIIKVLCDQCFKNKDLAGVDFAAIEKDLATDIQSPWGGNGW